MTQPSRINSNRRRRVVLLAALAALTVPTAYASAAIAGDASASSASADSASVAAAGLGLAPATGAMDVPVSVTIPAACPTGADSIIIQITGGGFPDNANVLGVTDITGDPSATSWTPGTWEQIAANNQTSASALTGTADLKLLCLNGPTPQDYTAQVSFAGSPKAYTLLGDATATPTPTPTATGTPTPTPTPTPEGTTPTPTPTPAAATPTPTPQSDPTPTPKPADSDSTDGGSDQGGAVSGGKTNLPDTGSHARPVLWLAAFLVCSGAALLLLTLEPWLAERKRAGSWQPKR